MRVALRCWWQLASVCVLSRRLHALLLRRCHRRRLVLLLHVATATPSIVMRWRPRLLLRVASTRCRHWCSGGAASAPVAAAAAAIPACPLRRRAVVPAPVSTCAAAAATAVLSLIAIALRPIAAGASAAASYTAHMLRSSLCILVWSTVAVPARAADAVVLPAVPVVMLPRVATIAAPIATSVPTPVAPVSTALSVVCARCGGAADTGARLLRLALRHEVVGQEVSAVV